MNEFGPIATIQKTGNEELTFNNSSLGLSLLNFWQWSTSDLVSNATRGRLAEFIVAAALGIDTTIVRDEWGAYDLESAEGIKIEVKASAYIQTWKQKKLSPVSFSIKNTRTWNTATGVYNIESKRQADIYVFCLLHHTDQATINPLNLNQWEFYVCSAQVLNEKYPLAKSISLTKLKRLVTLAPFDKLQETIMLNSKSV